MTHAKSSTLPFSVSRRKLYLAIATQMMVAAGAQAAPTGGEVVAGDGSIDQSGLNTTIVQNTDRMTVDWQSFNIQADERVQFVQPSESSVALNRILGNEASQIFGRLDANGHVILMNPNGVLFGENATINVGGLVASGLAINPDDFMNGEFALHAVEGKDGTVINQGIINAATGGNVALIGKQVDNQGLISANLGSVTLAAGKEAVLTFDQQGLLGVRVTKEILQGELGVDAAVANNGEINAEGGRILLTASVSQDIFSQAVNAGELNDKTSVVMHQDGSFTLGGGADVINAGELNTSSENVNAGQIVVLGENVTHSGRIHADGNGNAKAGDIELHAKNTTLLTQQSQTTATAKQQGVGGDIKVLGERVGVFDESVIDTSGKNGGGNINIGGGFQGKNPQLRNATRTVVGKNTSINADALENGDGGEVIIWADDTTAFTGNISVRGGELGGDGGFVEVSGKENLKFDGEVDRRAVNGENGTLLLDPKTIEIVNSSLVNNNPEILDGEIFFEDSENTGLTLTAGALSNALEQGDVILQASSTILADDQVLVRPGFFGNGNSNALIMEAGSGINLLAGASFVLDAGDLILSAGLANCGLATCTHADMQDVYTRQGIQIGTWLGTNEVDSIITSGNVLVRSAFDLTVHGSITGGSVSLEARGRVDLGSVQPGGSESYKIESTQGAGEGIKISAGLENGITNGNWITSSGASYQLPTLSDETPVNAGVRINFVPTTDIIELVTNGANLRINSSTEIVSFGNLLWLDLGGTQGPGDLTLTAQAGDINLSFFEPIKLGEASQVGKSTISVETSGAFELPTFSSESESVQTDFFLQAQTLKFNTDVWTNGGSLQASADAFEFASDILIDSTNTLGLSTGEVLLTSEQDLTLPTIHSGQDLNATSTLGGIFSSAKLIVDGDTQFNAASEIRLFDGFSLTSAAGDVTLNAGQRIALNQFFLGESVLDVGGRVSILSSDGPIIMTGIFNAESFDINSTNGSLLAEQVEINANSSVNINLTNGVLNAVGRIVINSGELSATATALRIGDVIVNTDQSKGSGDINLVATGSAEEYDIWMPSINPDGLFTTGDLTVTASAAGSNVWVGDTQSGFPQYFGFSNLSGSATFDVAGDLYLPGINATNPRGERDITLNVGGTIFQNYDIFTGGGNYSANSSLYMFGDAVELNTDYSSSSVNSSIGAGNISLIETMVPQSPSSNIILQNIKTQADCANLQSCGDFRVTTTRGIRGHRLDSTDRTTIKISGDIDLVSALDVRLDADSASFQVDGLFSVSAPEVFVETEGGFEFGNWSVSDSSYVRVLSSAGRNADLLAQSPLALAGRSSNFETPGELILLNQRNWTVDWVGIDAIRTEIDHIGDMVIGDLKLTGGLAGKSSLFIIDGNFTSDASITGKFVPADLSLMDASPVVFDVTGDINLDSPDSQLSSIQIINAQDVRLINAADLNILGINAANLYLETSANITQSAPINVTGITEIVAKEVAGVLLEDATNNLNQLKLTLSTPNLVSITNSGNLTLDDIATDTAAASVRIAAVGDNATINQLAGSSINLANGGTLTLTADNLNLGAAGASSIEFASGTILVNVNNELVLDGAITGGDPAASALRVFGSTSNANTITVGENARFAGLNDQTSLISLGTQGNTLNINADLPVRVTSSDGNNLINLLAADINVAELDLGASSADPTINNNVLIAFAADNEWTIAADGQGQLQSGTGTINFSGVKILQGSSGDDVFTVEAADVNMILSGGEGVNKIYANQNDDTINNNWSILGRNTGTLNSGVNFSFIQHLAGNGGNDVFTFVEDSRIASINGNAGDDVVNLARGVIAGFVDAGIGQDTLNADGLNFTYTYLKELVAGDADFVDQNFEVTNNQGGSKTIVGVDGYDAVWNIDGDGTVTVVANNGADVTNSFTSVTRLEGADGNDTFVVLNNGRLTDQIVGGQGGVDTLRVDNDSTNDWRITGANSGEVATDEVVEPLKFSNIRQLVGGAGDDHFQIETGASVNGYVVGGSGNNSLAMNDASTVNTWTIGTASLLTAEAGGQTVSLFEFGDFQTLIGGANLDRLDVSGRQGSVDLRTGVAAGFNFVGMDSFISDGGMFVGTDADTNWALDESSSLSYTDADGIAREVTFRGFRDISAGAGADYFRISGLWSDEVASIFAISGEGAVDSVELAILGVSSVWRFNSSDSTDVYFDAIDTNVLFDMDRAEAWEALNDSNELAFSLAGIEENIGGAEDDAFMVYGDAELYDYIVEGGLGNDYLLGFNWGVPQDLVWNITEDFGGHLNNTVVFSNVEHLKSYEFPSAGSATSIFNVGEGITIKSIVGDTRDTVYNIGANSNIESIIDNGGTDTINAPNTANTWQLNSTGGSINANNFSGIEQLNGGTGADDFVLLSATVEATDINGGAGVNSLTAFNQDNTWNIQSADSTLGALTFNSINNLIGGDGVDTFIVNESTSVDLRGGGGIDELRGSALVNAWVVDGNYAGSLNDVTVFESVENLTGNIEQDNFAVAAGVTIGQIAGGAGDDVITIGEGATAINILGEAGSDTVILGDAASVTGMLDGGVGDTDIIDLSAFSGAFEYDFSTNETNSGLTYTNFEQQILPAEGASFFGGDGDTRWIFAANDSFTIQKLDATGNVIRSENFSGYSALRGGVGTNEFTLAETSIFDGRIQGDVAGDNTLIASNLINSWLINGQNQGQLQADGGTEITLFSNIANLIGGTDSDTFNLGTGGSITGSIDGGAGADSLIISDAAAVNNWQLGAQNSLALIAQFQGIETLVGNANDDTFAFSGATDVTALQGGAGNNSMLWSAGDVAINLGTQQINGVISFAEVASFVADDVSNNALIAGDGANNWTLTGVGSGSVAQITFSGFDELHGGAGEDTLIGLDADAQWEIGLSDDPIENVLRYGAQNIVFTGVEQLIGGAGDDSFLIAGSLASVDGGAGADNFVLEGDGQVGILVGGAGIDVLTGKSEPDIYWNLTGDNAGTMGEGAAQIDLEFTGVEILEGGEFFDFFTIAEGATFTELRGRGGFNTVTATGDNNWVIGDRVGEVGGISLVDITTFVGGDGADEFVIVAQPGFAEIDGGAGTNVIVGQKDLQNVWDLAAGMSPANQGSLNETLTFANITQIMGGDSGDQFILGATSAIDLIGGAGEDTLQAAASDNVWTIAGAANSVNDVTFSGIEVLLGGAAVDTMTVAAGVTVGDLHGGAGNDVIAVGEGASVANIFGEAGSDSVVLSNLVTVGGIVDGGTDGVDDTADGVTDILDISAFTSANEFNFLTGESSLGFTRANFELEIGAADSSLFSGDGDFVWTFNADNTFTITGEGRTGTFGVASYSSVRAGVGENSFIFDENARFAGHIQGDAAGNNSLTANNLIDTWLINGVNSGSMSGESGALVTTFSNIANLIGGAGNDVFEIAMGGSITGSIDGGAGADSLIISDAAAVNNWQLGTQNSLALIAQFQGIETLVGNANDDTFAFSGATDVTAIQGGAGSNSVMWSAGDVAINLGTQQINDVIDFSDIGSFAADVVAANTLISGNGTNIWQLTDINSGVVNAMEFSGFNRLRGVSAEDTLIGFDADAQWQLGTEADLTRNVLTVAGSSLDFSGMEILVGGAAQDTFEFLDNAGEINANGVTQVRGGQGDDLLYAKLQSRWDVNAAGGVVSGIEADTSVFLSFDSFESLQANYASFKITDLTTITRNFTSDDAAGVIDFSAIQGALAVDLDNPAFGFNGIISFIGNGVTAQIGNSNSAIWWLGGYDVSSSDDIINGWTNFAGRWYSGSDAATRFNDGETPDYYFMNFGAITAGAGDDTFYIEPAANYDITPIIDGGAGINSIHLRGENIAQSQWTVDALNAGTLNAGATFQNIQHLHGNAGNDTFTFAANSSIESINAGAGDDNFILANNITTGLLDGGDGQDTLDRAGLNSIVTYLRDVIGGDAVYTTANIETQTASGGSTTVVGVDGYNAQWTIEGDGSISVAFTDTNGATRTDNFTDVTRLQGGSGADEFILLPGGAIANGILGSGDDTLRGSDTTNTWTINAVNGGELAVQESGTTLLFQGIANLIGGAGNDVFEIATGGSITGSIDGGAGADSLIISDAAAVNNWQLGAQNSLALIAQFQGIETLVGNANDDTFAFSGATDVTAIQGGAGNNSVLWSAGDVAINLGTGLINSAIAFSGIQAVDADAASTNTLTGADENNTWLLTANDAGTVNTFSFSGFNVLQGGSAQDSVQATAANNIWANFDPATNTLNNTLRFSGMEELRGGAADDSFSTALVGVTNVDGGLGNNTVSAAADSALTWQINTTDGSVSNADGSLNLAFSNIQTLSAAIAPSLFVVNDLNTIVTNLFGAPSAGNTLDFSNLAGALVLDAQAMPFNLQNVDTFVGNGAQSSVVSNASSHLWMASGAEVALWMDGRFDETTSLTPADMIFRNFAGFTGGAGVDDFVVDADASPVTFNGAAGDNHLFANAAVDNDWTIDAANSGTLNTSTAFANIQNLHGNAGADTFTFAANSSITNIDAGAGDDSFILANNITTGLLDGGEGQDTLDRAGINSIVTYLRDLIGGDAVYTTANIETQIASGGSYTVVGVDGYSAQWTIEGDGSISVAFTDTNGATRTDNFTDVTRLQGGSGADEFILLPGGAIANGILGSGDDSLRGSDTTNTWTINAANGGELAVQESGTTLLFQGIANLIGGAGNEVFEIATGGSITGSIDGGAGADSLIISDAAAVNNWQLAAQNSVNAVMQFRAIESVVGNANVDTFVFSGATDVTAIDGGAGANQVDWTAGDVAVNLGSALLNDTVQFSGIAAFSADPTAANTLAGADAANVWTLNGADAGTVVSGTITTAFSGFGTLQGGSQNDALTVAVGGSLSGGFDGGAGVDSLTAADQTNTWSVDAGGGTLNTLRFDQVETLIGGAADDAFVLAAAAVGAQSVDGGAGANRLTGFDQNNTWTVTSNSAGTVTGLAAFSNMQTLLGGAADDSFTLAAGVNLSEIYGGAGNDQFVIGRDVSADNIYGEAGDDSFVVDTGLTLSGVLDGGTGAEVTGDLLDLSKFTVLTASNDLEALVGFAFRNFETIKEPNNEGVYFGGDGTNFWYITGENQGRLEVVGGSNAGVYTFSGVHSLLGGSGEDVFIFADDAAAVTTIIDGGAGAGANTLDLSAQGLINQWLLDGSNSGRVVNNSNTAGNVFTNIAYLIGGNGQDTFTLQAGGAIAGGIDGGLGADDLTIAVAQNSTWQLGGAAGHSVNGIASFQNIENLTGSSGDDTFNVQAQISDVTRIHGAGGFDLLTFQYLSPVMVDLRSGTAAGMQVSAIERFVAAESFGTLGGADVSSSWVINGENAGRVSYLLDTGVEAVNVEFDGFGNLRGGAADDRFTLQAGAALAGTLDAGAGNDVLVSDSAQATQWNITAADAGNINSQLAFAAVENLQGGQGQDNFVVTAAGAISGRIDGGAGAASDSLSHAGVNNLWSLALVTEDGITLAGGTVADNRFSGIERLVGAGANDTLSGGDQNNTWSLGDTAVNTYVDLNNNPNLRMSFTGMEAFAGGSGDDVFNVVNAAALPKSIDGGTGQNTVNLQAVAADLHVAMNSDVTLADGLLGLTLANIDLLQGNGRTVLYGAGDQSYTWTINGLRSGQVTSTLVDPNNQLLAFENLSAIMGGVHDDIFRVTAASPLLSLDGGAAATADFVDYSLVNGNLTINLTDALSGQNSAIAGIEGIRGNNAGPSAIHTAELVGGDGANLWTISDFDGEGVADGINDGQVTFGGQTIAFLDFNVLSGGAGVDTFNQTTGVVLGTLRGGAGNDVFNVQLGGNNLGTLVDGGLGTDSLTLSGGSANGLMTYTANAMGGEFAYSQGGDQYKVSHQAVETLAERSLAQLLDIRGSSLADTISLGNERFWINGGDVITHQNKTQVRVTAGINDFIEIAENLAVADTLTLANGTVISNDPDNTSITARQLVLDSTRDVGLASARLRTSVDDLAIRNSAGDIYLQEQNGLNLAEFNANGVVDLLVRNGDLTNSAPLHAADVVRANAANGNITLTGANQLRDDVALIGERVELHNATTLTLVDVLAEELILKTQRGIEGDGRLVVSGLTEIDAQGDVRFDFATNDFNRVRVTNAWNLTLVDQNALELLDVNASGAVVIRSTNNVTLNDRVAGGTGVDVSSGIGSVNQNGTITTGSGSVVVSANNGEVNLGDDARIVANGGSVSINAGTGNVNMGGGTKIAANGGNVNIDAADSVVVAEVVSSGNVSINAGSGNVSDGNGGSTNITAGGLQSSSNTGFGSNDAIETTVGNIDISTNTGNVAVNNSGDVKVDNITTGNGDVNITNEGNVDLAAGSVSAEKGEAGGQVNLDVSKGSVKQTGPNSVPAITGGSVTIRAPDGSVGEGGGLRVDADQVFVTALVKSGEIFVNPGADKIEYFSGSFKFEDQLLAVEPLDDINPAIFTNVRSYFFNDISLLLPSDQLYDDEEEDEE